MRVSIFLPCYNESRIIRQTIEHYRMCFSDPSFTIYDNYSTDNSVEIAKELGCTVIYWSSNNFMSEHHLLDIRNNCWKAEKGWVIVCDMDEWLNITDEALQQEEANGTTILHIRGFNMVGESKSEMVDDIELHAISKGVVFERMNKNICFDARFIKNMNFVFGAHKCCPEGFIKYSQRTYILKHMDNLGLPYKQFKHKSRYERNEQMRQQNLNLHYLQDSKQIEEKYATMLNKACSVNDLFYNHDTNLMTRYEQSTNSTCRSDITVFIFCLHDVYSIRQSIVYYATLFPNVSIVLCLEAGSIVSNSLNFYANFYKCSMVYFENIHDIQERSKIKSHCWKSVSNHWVFIVEDNEWLDITENNLFSEDFQEKTVLTCVEYKDGNPVPRYLGFKRSKLFEINYNIHGEIVDPVGIVQYTDNKYALKKLITDPSKNINIPKYKILVLMTENRPLNNLFDKSEYYSLVAAINYAYCLRHGYDFKYMETFYKHKNATVLHNCINPLPGEMRHASWSKLLAVSSQLEHYDYIVYIDSDCIFHNQFITIESLIDMEENKNKDFIFLNHQPWNPGKPSSGFFICRGSPTVRSNLKEWYETPIKSINDRMALWNIYRRFNCTVLDIPMNFFKDNNQYLCHLASNLDYDRIPYFRRVVIMKNINYTLIINKIMKDCHLDFDTSLSLIL